MNDNNINDNDMQKLAKIADDFTAKVVADYKQEKKFDPVTVFVSKLSLKDKFNILVSKYRRSRTLSSETASPEKKARAIVKYCEAVLPGLKKAFGEAFLVRSLPVEAQDDRVIGMAQSLGAHGVAALCEKAKARAKAQAPSA